MGQQVSCLNVLFFGQTGSNNPKNEIFLKQTQLCSKSFLSSKTDTSTLMKIDKHCTVWLFVHLFFSTHNHITCKLTHKLKKNPETFLKHTLNFLGKKHIFRNIECHFITHSINIDFRKWYTKCRFKWMWGEFLYFYFNK